MDIIMKRALDARMLDIVARGALGAATVGVSVNEGMSRVHLPQGNPPEQGRASDLLSNFGALRLTPGTAPRSSGAPHIFSLGAGVFAEDEQIAFAVAGADAVVQIGRAAAANNQISLDLSELAAGDYSVIVYRLRDTYASGMLPIRIAAE